MNHKKKVSNNLNILLVCFGVLFTSSGLISALQLIKYPEKTMLDVIFETKDCVLPLLLGVSFFAVGIKNMMHIKSYNNFLADSSAYVTKATYIDAVETKEGVWYTIIYSYFDECGIERQGKSMDSFHKEQAEYLKEKGKFSIQCKGKMSVIIESFPL